MNQIWESQAISTLDSYVIIDTSEKINKITHTLKSMIVDCSEKAIKNKNLKT